MQNIYYVVEPERVVALDLAHAIRAHDPQAELRLFTHVEDALAALAQRTPRAIFLDQEPGPFLESAAGKSLAGQGIAMIFTGRLAAAGPDQAEVLAMPFSESSVAAALLRLSDRLAEDDA